MGRVLLAELPEYGLEYMWSNRMEPEALAAGVPDDIVAFLRKRLLSNHPTGLVAMAHEVLGAPDRCAELAECDLDLLVLYGEHDDGWPPVLQAEMARRLDAECVVVPGALHSPAVEAPRPPRRPDPVLERGGEPAAPAPARMTRPPCPRPAA